MDRKLSNDLEGINSPAEIGLAVLGLGLKNEVGNSEKEFPIAQLLQLVLDNIPQEVFWKNRDSVYVWCNSKFAVAAGVETPDKIVGKTDYDLAWTKDQADFFRLVDQRVMRNNTPEYHIFEPQTQANGRNAWFVTNKMPLYDKDGNVVGILGTAEDDTKRKESEETLQKAYDELEMRVKERTAAEREQRILAEALRETSSILSSTLNLDEVLDRILVAIGRVVPHETTNIILVKGSQAHIVRSRDQAGKYGISQNTGKVFPLDDFPNLDYMASNQQPMIISETQGNAYWIQKPKTSWVRSYLGAPIQKDGKVIGFINLNSATPNFFNALHAERLKAFADQAAIAINNARLYTQAQELATMKERQRLARDLHDAVSQTLWTACLITDVLPTVWKEDPEEGHRNLEKLQRLTRGALAEMRTLLLELRPKGLVEASLGNLLEQLAQALMSRKKLNITVNSEGDGQLPPDVQIGFYRLAQESLNNIAKHSRATSVVIHLQYQAESVTLSIQDDGRGFDLSKITPESLGINIMRERAETIGSSFDISTNPGDGVCVTVVWPSKSQGKING
ncbi:MAG: histidine kinase [Anaerolineaceae bacterium]